jgi:regulator of ribonuclease activity A
LPGGHSRPGADALPTDRRDQGLRDVPVQIEGVWVRPGDWLYADEDGIVVMAQPA